MERLLSEEGLLKMNNKTAWWLVMILYAIDILIITPYALAYHNVREVGDVCAWGFYNSGLEYWFFPIWLIVTGIIFWFVLKFFFWLVDKLPKKLARIIENGFVIVLCSISIAAIINNLRVIF